MADKEKIIPAACGAVLFILSAVLSISLIKGILDYGNIAGNANFLYRFGSMLFSVYGLSSILIPVFLFVSGIFCIDSSWSLPKLMSLSVSFIPFFTMAGAEHLAKTACYGDSGAIAVIKAGGIMFIAALLSALEYLGTIFASGRIEDKLTGGKKSSDSYTPEKLERKARKLKAVAVADDDFTGDGDYVKDDEFIDLTSAENAEKGEDGETVIEDDKAEDLGTSEEDKKDFDPDDPDYIIENQVEKSIQEATDDSSWALDEILKKHKKMVEESSVTDLPALDDGWSIDDDGELKDLISQSDEDAESDEDGDDYISEMEELNKEESDDYLKDLETVEEEKGFNAQANLDDEDYSSDAEAESNLADIDAADDSKESTVEDTDLDAENDKPKKTVTNHAMINALDTVFARMEQDAMDDYKSGELDDHYDYDEDGYDEESDTEDDFTDNKDTDISTENLDNTQEDITEPVIDDTDIDTEPLINEEGYDFDDKDNKKDNNSLQASSTDESKVDLTKTAQETVVTPEGKMVSSPIPRSVAKRPKNGPYKIPTDLLTAYEDNPYWIIDEETQQSSQLLKDTLSEFKINAEVTGIRKGPVVTMFEILPAPGVKLNKIVALQDNIALRLAASSVRIVAPIPGKRAVGIEVPNRERAIVSFRECIEQNIPEWKKYAVPVVLGKDIQGDTQIFDLVKTPHLLIAGSTGSGKSVCVNSIIMSILFKRSPDQVKMILIDPKIVELKLYNDIPHLLTPVITEPKKAIQALQYCLCEMERRYALLDGLEVRDISTYNRKIEEKKYATEKLPYLIVIIDEFADLMATTGKALEGIIARLAAMSRAVGIHLVLATQRPSIDVITGLIKANIPSRIAFMVASKMDSRIILDQVGAEKLLGKGDMLYASATDPFPVRIQGTFVSDDEVENAVEYVKQWGEPEYIDDEIFVDDEEEDGGDQVSLFSPDGEDPLYDKALEIVVQAGKASASYIQRRLKIGYNRAARLVEEMEERGIVGPANGSKPRELLHVP